MTPFPLPEAVATRRDILPTRDLLEAGMSRARITRAVAAGVLDRNRRGWYSISTKDNDRIGRFQAATQAAVLNARERGRPIVLAGPSAALWWGLPLVGALPGKVTVAGSMASGQSASDLTRNLTAPPDDQITCRGGVGVTTPARTVVDSARLLGARPGLVLADAALARGLVSRDELAEVAASVKGFVGAGHARWCAEHADGLSESPGESISRYAMIQARIPSPELQAEVTLPDGSTARVDFYWHFRRHVGEFDGLTKYGGEACAGMSANDVVIREKLREDGLRELGLQVTRWTWADAWSPEPWIRRLRSALAA